MDPNLITKFLEKAVRRYFVVRLTYNIESGKVEAWMGPDEFVIGFLGKYLSSISRGKKENFMKWCDDHKFETMVSLGDEINAKQNFSNWDEFVQFFSFLEADNV